MTKKMSRDQALEFLSEGTRTGKLATVRADGRPHVAPIWFIVEDGDIVFNTWHESVKGRNLAREGRASMVVDLQEPPYAYVLVEGAVTVLDDVGEGRRVAALIGGRYMGADRAEEFGERNGVEGELVVRLSIDKVVAMDDVAGYG